MDPPEPVSHWPLSLACYRTGFKGATMKDNKAAAFGGGAVIGALGGLIHNCARKLQLEMENGHAKPVHLRIRPSAHIWRNALSEYKPGF